MKTLAVVVILIVAVCFIGVLIFQKKQYRFGNDETKAKRISFYNRYQGNEKLKESDKALFDELFKTGLVTSRGTEHWVSLTRKGFLILTKEEFDARCDLRAKILRAFSVLR